MVKRNIIIYFMILLVIYSAIKFYPLTNNYDNYGIFYSEDSYNLNYQNFTIKNTYCDLNNNLYYVGAIEKNNTKYMAYIIYNDEYNNTLIFSNISHTVGFDILMFNNYIVVVGSIQLNYEYPFYSIFTKNGTLIYHESIIDYLYINTHFIKIIQNYYESKLDFITTSNYIFNQYLFVMNMSTFKIGVGLIITSKYDNIYDIIPVSKYDMFVISNKKIFYNYYEVNVYYIWHFNKVTNVISLANLDFNYTIIYSGTLQNNKQILILNEFCYKNHTNKIMILKYDINGIISIKKIPTKLIFKRSTIERSFNLIVLYGQFISDKLKEYSGIVILDRDFNVIFEKAFNFNDKNTNLVFNIFCELFIIRNCDEKPNIKILKINFDSDNDNIPNNVEIKNKTNPFSKDTDLDLINDDVDSEPLKNNLEDILNLNTILFIIFTVVFLYNMDKIKIFKNN